MLLEIFHDLFIQVFNIKFVIETTLLPWTVLFKQSCFLYIMVIFNIMEAAKIAANGTLFVFWTPVTGALVGTQLMHLGIKKLKGISFSSDWAIDFRLIT